VQIASNVHPRHKLGIVFATSNARVDKELSAGEVFWLGLGGGESETLSEKGKIMASPRLLKIVYLSLLLSTQMNFNEQKR
jgi:hypothetical protein